MPGGWTSASYPRGGSLPFLFPLAGCFGLVRAAVHGAALARTDRSIVWCRGVAGKLGEPQDPAPGRRVACDSQSSSALQPAGMGGGMGAQDAAGPHLVSERSLPPLRFRFAAILAKGGCVGFLHAPCVVFAQ